MKNKQLTAADRGAIEVLLRKHFTPKEVASEIGKDKSTVCREIKNRSTPNGYFAKSAQLHYESKRKLSCKPLKIDTWSLRGYIESSLRKGWSPEQIIGRMRYENNPVKLCKETIYRFIYLSKYGRDQKLYQYLRFGRKRRKHHNGRSVHCEKIANKVSIHERPDIVNERVEFGHWEGDSVVYANKRAINTMNELTTGIVAFKKLERRTAGLTGLAIIDTLQEYGGKSLTVDNGMEFGYHEEITKQSGVQVYFADPYSSWQRGSNENCNMLLRGFLPKRANIDNLTQAELDDIACELNNRPRKRLGYKTPSEVYLAKLIQEATVAVEIGM